MQTLQPLKTLIFYQSQAEVEALLSFTKKFSSVFTAPRICRSTFDLLNVLNSESFDLTFFDETAFPYTIIDRCRIQLGIIAFKNKETISWKLTLETSRNGYLQFNPLAVESRKRFLEALTAENLNSSPQGNQIHLQSGPKLTFKDGYKLVSLYQEEIIHIQTDDKLSTIHYEAEGKLESITQWNGLTEFENLLDPQLFFRTHRKHLVNLRYFKGVCYKTNRVMLTKKKNDEHIVLDVSFRQLRELKRILKQSQNNKNVRLRTN
jgi:LytTr DNA-binding domain